MEYKNYKMEAVFGTRRSKQTPKKSADNWKSEKDDHVQFLMKAKRKKEGLVCVSVYMKKST